MSFPQGRKPPKKDALERFDPANTPAVDTAQEPERASTENMQVATREETINIHYIRALETFGHSCASQRVQRAIFHVEDEAITLDRTTRYTVKARAYAYTTDSIIYALKPMENDPDEVVLLSESSLLGPFTNKEGLRCLSQHDERSVEFLRVQVDKVDTVRREDGCRYLYEGRVVFSSERELSLVEAIKEDGEE